MPVVVAYGADDQTAHYCVVSTGAVLGHGRSNFLSWCRGRFLWSSVQKTINVLLLLLNTVIYVPVAQVVQFPLFGVRCSPVEHKTTDFPGLQEIFTYSALSGSTVDTCSASVFEVLWEYITRFPRV